MNWVTSNKKAIFFFFLVGILFFLSHHSIRNVQLRSKISKNDIGLENLFHPIARKLLIEGTYNSTFTNKTYNDIRSNIFHNLDLKMMLLSKDWEESNSYLSYEQNLNYLQKKFNPLIPYLIPKNLSQKNIIISYNYLSFTNMNISKIGYVEGDHDPSKGQITFSCNGGFALDKNERSIGCDLGEEKKVSALRLNSSTPKYRIESNNLSVWISNDNKSYCNNKGNLFFYFYDHSILIDKLDIFARYIKIHCNLKEGNYTFSENFNNILTAYAPPRFNR